MKRAWKEKYTLEKASSYGIHTYEDSVVNAWGNSIGVNVGEKGGHEWIYHVEVADFHFSFFSLEMMDLYIDFFGRKILPSSRFYGASPFSNGASIFVGKGQSPFERLPARLRKKNIRPRVHTRLKEAREYFAKNS